MIDKWILKTSFKINSGNAPKSYTTFDSYNDFILNQNTIAYPSQGINWISLIQGKLSVFSEQEAINSNDTLQFPIPVCNKLWVRSLSEFCELKSMSTREVLEDEINFLIALEKLQVHFYNQLCKNIEINSLFENNNLNDKLIHQEEQLKNTLEKIKSIVTGSKKKLHHPNNKKQNILYLTCQLIGEHASFTCQEPKHFESDIHNANNLLYAIAQRLGLCSHHHHLPRSSCRGLDTALAIT